VHRFFARPDGDYARITGEDYTHLSRVLRLKTGDRLTLSDGRGMDYEARIEALEPAAALCRVEAAIPSTGEPRCRVTLFQCLPKGAKLETIIQKCTELGAYCIQPVMSRCCVSVPADFSKKLPRYNRIAYEAAKQSRRGLVPEVLNVLPLSAVEPEDFDLVLLAYEREGERTLRQALRANPAPLSAALIIGPEGGFDEEEAAALIQRGAIAVSLGPRILRTETAGPTMLAQLLYEVEP
jgi:16S rRNA (uracil1498-N3)-methyltransferase